MAEIKSSEVGDKAKGTKINTEVVELETGDKIVVLRDGNGKFLQALTLPSRVDMEKEMERFNSTVEKAKDASKVAAKKVRDMFTESLAGIKEASKCSGCGDCKGCTDDSSAEEISKMVVKSVNGNREAARMVLELAWKSGPENMLETCKSILDYMEHQSRVCHNYLGKAKELDPIFFLINIEELMRITREASKEEIKL